METYKISPFQIQKKHNVKYAKIKNKAERHEKEYSLLIYLSFIVIYDEISYALMSDGRD